MTFSFKLVIFSKSYATKHKWAFFSEHSVYTEISIFEISIYTIIKISLL